MFGVTVVPSTWELIVSWNTASAEGSQLQASCFGGFTYQDPSGNKGPNRSWFRIRTDTHRKPSASSNALLLNVVWPYGAGDLSGTLSTSAATYSA